MLGTLTPAKFKLTLSLLSPNSRSSNFFKQLTFSIVDILLAHKNNFFRFVKSSKFSIFRIRLKEMSRILNKQIYIIVIIIIELKIMLEKLEQGRGEQVMTSHKHNLNIVTNVRACVRKYPLQ